jgi:hypothetical protein
MNQKIGKAGAFLMGVSTLVFAVSMFIGFFTDTLAASCIASFFIAVGYLLFISSVFAVSHSSEKKAAGYAGLLFGAVYAVIIFLVYYAESTTVRLNNNLSTETLSIISFGHVGSLFFNYDLLGYGFMALSTFLTGFMIEPKSKSDRVLRGMLWLHGVFFIPCFLMPMFPIFNAGGQDNTGVIALELWCLYFLPICVLGYGYFRQHKQGTDSTGNPIIST